MVVHGLTAWRIRASWCWTLVNLGPPFLAGVIAVAVFGLYGAATSKFDISAKLEESGAFDDFWDTFAFVANGIVFFYAGASSINFVIRCSLLLDLRQLLRSHSDLRGGPI